MSSQDTKVLNRGRYSQNIRENVAFFTTEVEKLFFDCLLIIDCHVACMNSLTPRLRKFTLSSSLVRVTGLSYQSHCYILNQLDRSCFGHQSKLI